MFGSLLILAALTGCARTVDSPLPPPRRDPSNRWSALLTSASTKDGVDYELIAKQKKTLEQYIWM